VVRAVQRREHLVNTVTSPLAPWHSAATPAASLRVDSNGAWIALADGTIVPCEHRVATQRLLAALARARIEMPGTPVGTDDLVAIGWPGERILFPAARNRLRVALSWLRTNALGGALLWSSGGYLLDPEHVVIDLAGATLDAHGDARHRGGRPHLAPRRSGLHGRARPRV
jgi:hypothetical protein